MEQEMYVARDKTNELYFYIGNTPKKDDSGIWIIGSNSDCYKLNPNLFPEVKWTDRKSLQG